MPPYSRKLFVADTDFSGFLYFSKMQDIGLECFIDNVGRITPDAKELLFQSDYLFPIVHASADYKKGAKVGDFLECHLYLLHMGNTSFSYKVEIYTDGGDEVGCVEIVHVCVDKEKGGKTAIRDEFREVLGSIDKFEELSKRS